MTLVSRRMTSWPLRARQPAKRRPPGQRSTPIVMSSSGPIDEIPGLNERFLGFDWA